MKKDKFMEMFSNLFNKKDSPKESDVPKITPDETIANYLQEKQTKNEKMTAKDYFANDILNNTAVDNFVKSLKTMLGATNVKNGSTCNSWNDNVKYASVSATIFDYVEDGILIILGVSANENEADTVDVLIGNTDDPDVTLELADYPDDAKDASVVYSNAADKVIDFLLSKDIL